MSEEYYTITVNTAPRRARAARGRESSRRSVCRWLRLLRFRANDREKRGVEKSLLHNRPRGSTMGAETGRKRRAEEASGSARRIEVEDVKALFAEQKGHLDYFFDEVRARFPFDPLSTSSPTTNPV